MSVFDYDDIRTAGRQMTVMLIGVAIMFSSAFFFEQHKALATVMIVAGIVLLVFRVEDAVLLLLRLFRRERQ